MTTGAAYWKAKRARTESQITKREDLLARPDLLENKVAVQAGLFSTSTKRVRSKRGETKLNAFTRAHKGTPMEGLGSDLLNAYTAALEDPKLLNVSNKHLLTALSKELVTAPGEDGMSRLEKGWEHKYRSDTGLGNLFGMFGEDKDVKRLPGYEEYLAKKRTAPVDEWHTGPIEAAGIGAGFTAAMMAGSKMIGRAGFAIPHPVAKIAGAALMAIPEFMAFDAVHNVISKTDWGRAREGTWRKLGVDMLAGGAVIGSGHKAATIAIKKAAEKSILSKGMTELLMKHPTAKKVIETVEVQKAARIAQERANASVAKNIKREDVFDKFVDLDQVLVNIGKEKKFVQEAARPTVPRMPGPGLVKPATPGARVVPTTPAAKATLTKPSIGAKVDSGVQSILDIQMPRAKLSAKEARRVAAQELTDLRFDMALKKAAKTKDINAAIAEQREVQRLAKAQAKKEKLFLAKQKGDVVAETTKQAAAAAKKEAKKVAKKRAAQRTKLIKKKKVEADIAEVISESIAPKIGTKIKPGKKGKITEKTVSKEERLKLIEERSRLRKQEQQELEKLLNEDVEAQLAADSDRFVSLEQAGLVETFEGGIEEGFVEGVKKGGKDLVDLMKDGAKLTGIVGAGLLGSIALSDLFEANTAEASMLTKAAVTVPKMVAKTVKNVASKESMAKLAKEWRDINALHIPAAAGAKAKTYFQEAMRTASLAVKEHGSLVKNIKAKTTPLRLVKLLSPYTSGEILYKINPIPEIGNLQSVIGNNAGDSLKVVGNILHDVPGIMSKTATKDIVKTMSSLAEKFSTDVTAYRTTETEIAHLTKSYNKLYKALSKEKGEMHLPALEKMEQKVASWKAAREELAPAFEAYTKEWEGTVKKLAEKYPTTRITLAIEDTAAFDKYPWLKQLITPEEEEAVIHLKNMYETFGVRMAEAGHDIIEGPYCHHAIHPDWLESGAAKRLEDFGLDSKGIPFVKFHRRAKYSKQMVPDINYVMQRYIMDAERRIQWSQFWGKGQKNSWYSHKRWVDTFGTKDQVEFWKKIADSSIPPAQTRANNLANIYSSFEVLRLLAFSPSVALKHYFKNIGTMSTMGVGNFMTHLPEAAITAVKGSKNSPEMKAIYKRFGIKSSKGKNSLFQEVAGSFTNQIHRMNMVADLDFEAMIPDKAGFWQAATKKLQSFNRWGSIPVRAIESVDRHHTLIAAWEAAAKKGMTAQQAMYGVYSNILKLNFLSGAANPAWVRNPKIRAIMLFQNTAFKIMERRLMVGWRAGKDVKTALGVIRHQDIQTTLKEMGEIGKYVIGAEKEMKQNMIFDALTGNKDFFGTPAIKQAMTEAILSGAILMGGGAIGMNLMPQVWHVPIVKHGAKAPTLAVNPFVNSAFRTLGEREDAEAYGVEKDFFITQFMKNWLKSTGYIPQTMNKMVKITQDDIPDIYKGSKWKYFFSVPAKEEH